MSPFYPTARRHRSEFIGPPGGLQVDKPKVGKVTGSVDAPHCSDEGHTALKLMYIWYGLAFYNSPLYYITDAFS